MECGGKGGTTATPLSDRDFADGENEKWRLGWKLSACGRCGPLLLGEYHVSGIPCASDLDVLNFEHALVEMRENHP